MCGETGFLSQIYVLKNILVVIDWFEICSVFSLNIHADSHDFEPTRPYKQKTNSINCSRVLLLQGLPKKGQVFFWHSWQV